MAYYYIVVSSTCYKHLPTYNKIPRFDVYELVARPLCHILCLILYFNVKCILAIKCVIQYWLRHIGCLSYLQGHSHHIDINCCQLVLLHMYRHVLFKHVISKTTKGMNSK